MPIRKVASINEFSHLNTDDWNKVKSGISKTASRVNLIEQASRILNKPFKPENYLLTHASIVASVDTEVVPNVRLGTFGTNLNKVNRRYGDYRITEDTQKWINNNSDAFSRGVLLKAYNTFIGAHNFVEHIQLEELSKGRIIDVVPRDVGGSIYADILIATDRAHTSLIRDIESKKLATLSMGCLCDFTVCTKCGNVAVDESELCYCIRYEKGKSYFDELGVRRKIAELCGHETAGIHGGVRFIEASWVEKPAFTGAVVQTMLNMNDNVTPYTVMTSEPSLYSYNNLDFLFTKQASETSKVADMPLPPGLPPLGGGGGDAAPAPEDPSKAMYDDITKEINQYFFNTAKKIMKDKLNESEGKEQLPPSDLGNDSVFKEASFVSATKAYMKSSKNLNDFQFISGIKSLFKELGHEVPSNLLKLAYDLGPLTSYPNEKAYARQALVNYRKIAGTDITTDELRFVGRISSLLAIRR